jgi:hypothetical protein
MNLQSAKFFLEEKPAVVICAAAKVGGIKANNDYPVQFSSITCESRTMSSTGLTIVAVRSFSFSAAPAFTEIRAATDSRISFAKRAARADQ